MWARAGEEDWPVYQSRTFLCILRALDKAGVRPHSFQVILRHLGLDDFAFNLPKFVHVQSVLAVSNIWFFRKASGNLSQELVLTNY